MYDKISSWSLVCFYLLANQKHLPRRLVVSGQTVRAVLAKTRSLQNAPTLLTSMEGWKPSTSIFFFCQDLLPKASEVARRLAGNI